ncbi:MAG: signal peptidase I, partial [Bacteroidales bacterium]|nr:signal peptidase I [Bacteroidales bacterium]
MSVSLLIFILAILIIWASLYSLFEKAGEKGWKALVPVYNIIVWIRISGKPRWWLVLFFLPFINLFMVLLLSVEAARAFGKTKLSDHAMAAVLPFLYLPYLVWFRKDAFLQPQNRPKVKKGVAREWFEAI